MQVKAEPPFPTSDAGASKGPIAGPVPETLCTGGNGDGIT